MKYGCIGERLGHSFSKEIHNALADYEYELLEIERDKLADFALNKNFSAVNVTIPYKEMIIPYLYEIDENAKRIGAVNTVVNRDGRLYGYNTDYYGLVGLIRRAGINPDGKTCLVLGTGGTSKTARAALASLGAGKIYTASRSKGEGTVGYDELDSLKDEVEVIVNTTPVGMYPKIYESPIDISSFTRLIGVVDVVYNPLRTPLVLSAIKKGIPALGGLYMLVAQAVRASEIFLDTEYINGELSSVYERLVRSKENVVLIGMPASGKSTVGAIIAKRLNRKFVDTDTLIEERIGMPISDFFAKYGETEFRKIESEVISETAKSTSLVIATGGGAILMEENVDALRQNGKLFFIDRPLELLIPTSSRPLSSDRASIEKRYNERYEIYVATADAIVDGAPSAEEVAAEIERSFFE